MRNLLTYNLAQIGWRIGAALLVAALLIQSFSVVGYAQMSKEQKKLHNMKISYFDILACGVAASPTSQTNSGGSLYMLGDSITVGSLQQLETRLKEKGYQSFINASESRSIKRAGTTDGFKTSGLDAVEGDKVNIKDSGSVVIALGTNKDTNFESAMKELINKVRAINSTAKIYWVNVFSQVPDKDKINETIETVASDNDVDVINMADEEVPLASDNIHPNTEGQRVFAAGVADNIDKGLINDEPVADCSCSNSTSKQLSGKDNEQKIFNFLVGKGLTAKQAAGIVGNFAVESGGKFDPFIQEIGKTPPIGGHGIAQWTGTGRPGDPAGARRLNMVKAMEKAGIKVDLGTQMIDKNEDPNKVLAAQLEYMWKEATDRGDIAKIKTETTVEGAVISWLKNFEVAGIPHTEARVKAGNDAMDRHGSGGNSDVASDSVDVSCEVDSKNAVSGEYSLPTEKKWYTSNKDWFTKPHHDYPAADIPVPSGSKIYAVVGGTVYQVGSGYGGGFGTSVFIKDKDGFLHMYAHGTPGSVKVSVGDSVDAGKLLMLSDNTGHSEGAHLHYEIRLKPDKSTRRCPQNLLEAIAEGESVPKIDELPASGCYY